MRKMLQRILAIVLSIAMFVGNGSLNGLAIEASADSVNTESSVSANEEVSANEVVSANEEVSSNADVSFNEDISANEEGVSYEIDETSGTNDGLDKEIEELPEENADGEDEIEPAKPIVEEPIIEEATFDGEDITNNLLLNVSAGEQDVANTEGENGNEEVTGLSDAAPVVPSFNARTKSFNFFAESFNLQIVTQEGFAYYYSLDGKNPTFADGKPGSNTFLYEGNILVTGKRKNVIKAISVNKNGECSKVATQTILLKPDIREIKILGIHEVPIGKSISLKAEVAPSYVLNKKVTWSIENYDKSNGVKVSSSGKVTASKKAVPGTYKIIVESKDDGDAIAEHLVTVTEKGRINSVKFSQKKVELERRAEDVTYSLKDYFVAEYVEGNSADVNEFYWSSSKPAVVSVDQEGKITLHGYGSAKITALANDGSGKKASITVKVKQYITGIAVTTKKGEAKAIVAPGKKVQLKATITPTKVTKKKVKWESAEDRSVFKVSASGNVSTFKTTPEGKYKVTCKAMDGSGVSTEYVVVVNKGSVTAARASVEVLPIFNIITEAGTDAATYGEADFIINADGGCREELCDIVAEENNLINIATQYKTDASTGELICTVKATSLGNGSGKVKVNCVDALNGEVLASFVVDVRNMASDIFIVPDMGLGKVLAAGYTTKMTAVIEEGNGAVATHEVAWSTSNEKIATVDKDGVVTAVSAGSVSIIAKLLDGSNMQATYNMKIVDGVITSIKTSSNKISLYRVNVNETHDIKTKRITVNVDGENGYTYEACEALSDDENLVRIRREEATSKEDGSTDVIFAIYTSGALTGETTVRFVSTDGGQLEKTIQVVVTNPPSGIHITQPEDRGDTIALGCSLKLTAEIEKAYGECGDVDITWSSSNTNCATVSDGLVTPHATGEVTISAEVAGTGIKAEKTYTIVANKVTTISAVTSGMTLFSRQESFGKILQNSGSIMFTVAMDGSAGNFESCVATSSNESVVVINEVVYPSKGSQSGAVTVNVTAVAAGEADITLRSTDGSNKSQKVSVKVVNPASSIEIIGANNAKGYMKLNTTLQLAAIIGEEYGVCSKDVIWKSSKDSVATVDQNGLVTAVATNTTAIKITATLNDGSGIQAEFPLIVRKGQITGISLNQTEATILKKDNTAANTYTTVKMTLSVESGFSDKAIGWKVSEDGYVKVERKDDGDDNSKTISFRISSAGEKAGKVDVTFMALDGSGETATIKVDVKSTVQTMVITPAEGRSKYLPKGSTLQLYVKGYDDDGVLCTEEATWKSSKPSVATVDEKTGLVTGIASSDTEVTITATANDEGATSATFKVNVRKGQITSLTLADTSADIFVVKPNGMSTPMEEAISVTATGTSGYTAKAVEVVGDGNIEKLVDVKIGTPSNGKFTITITSNKTGVGSGVLTLRSTDGSNISAKINVNVATPPSAINVTVEEGRDLYLPVNYKLQLYADVVAGYGECSEDIVWESSDSSKATVDQNGLVTAVNKGKSTIKAVAADGSQVYGSVVVEVMTNPVSSIKLSKTSIDIPLSGKTSEKEPTFTVELVGTDCVKKYFRIVVGNEDVVKVIGQTFNSTSKKTTIKLQSQDSTTKVGDSTWVYIYTTDGTNLCEACEVTITY